MPPRPDILLALRRIQASVIPTRENRTGDSRFTCGTIVDHCKPSDTRLTPAPAEAPPRLIAALCLRTLRALRFAFTIFGSLPAAELFRGFDTRLDGKCGKLVADSCLP